MITNIPKGETLSAVRKAAILIVALGEETSAGLLRNLTEEEVSKLSFEVARLGVFHPELTEKVLGEFEQMAQARQYVTQGGLDFAKGLLHKAFEKDRAARMCDSLVNSLGTSLANFDSLQRSDPQQLARIVHSEHPQTIALILSHLQPSQAAALLASLPAEMRGDVVLRVANLDKISPEIAARIAGVISERLRSIGGLSRESHGGARAVADVCNRLDSDMSGSILKEIEAADPAAAERIRNLMFVFEDILMLDEVAVNEVLTKVDRKTLVVALKGTSDQLKQHFTKRMSSRAREMLLEDLDALGAVKVRDVEGAQQQVIDVIRQLEGQGAISLRGSVGEQYVV